MTTAIYPGSFDPITNGHVDIAYRAAKLFDKLIIAVAEKKSARQLFTLGERVVLIEDVFSNNNNENIVIIDFETTKNMLKSKGSLDLLVMEYLPGDEFSTYVFADKGKMIYCVTNLRQKLNQYYSFEAKIVNNKKNRKNM